MWPGSWQKKILDLSDNPIDTLTQTDKDVPEVRNTAKTLILEHCKLSHADQKKLITAFSPPCFSKIYLNSFKKQLSKLWQDNNIWKFEQTIALSASTASVLAGITMAIFKVVDSNFILKECPLAVLKTISLTNLLALSKKGYDVYLQAVPQFKKVCAGTHIHISAQDSAINEALNKSKSMESLD